MNQCNLKPKTGVLDVGLGTTSPLRQGNSLAPLPPLQMNPVCAGCGDKMKKFRFL